MNYYPVFLQLEGRRCVVVGGGPIAAGKIAGLLDAGADVTVIAPVVVESIVALARSGRIRLERRPYRDGDLDGAFLVIAATDDLSTNQRVYVDATHRRCLVNVVDTKPLCNFISPALIRRVDLTVAVATNGIAPALASAIRRRLQRAIDEGYAGYLEQARLWRRRINRAGGGFETKKRKWYDLVRLSDPTTLADAQGIPTSHIARIVDRKSSTAKSDPATSGSFPIGVVGLDQWHAPLDPLERAARAIDDPRAFVERLLNERNESGTRIISGIVLLSTCQRFEIYYESPHPRQARRLLMRDLAGLCSISVREMSAHAHAHTGLAAIQHLFRVAVGLESLMAVENEIQGQVRRAYNIARTDSTLSPRLSTAFQAALALGKQMRRRIGPQPRRSMAHAAIGFALAKIGDLSRCEVRVLGDGVFAGIVARALSETGVNARQLSVEEIHRERPSDDRPFVVFGCQRSPTPVITKETASQWSTTNRERVYIIDLGLPRNVDPGVGKLFGVTLWDLDDLADACTASTGAADDLIPVVESLVAEAITRFSARHSRTQHSRKRDDPSQDTGDIPGTRSHRGSVTLVGAGPGDPRLLTVGGLRALEQADVILSDRLVSDEILRFARSGAQIVRIGKEPGGSHTSQETINTMLRDFALSAARVVRLKGGDPFVFGRGGEELEYLHAAGIPCDVIPGVSSAIAVPGALGIPLTHRGLSRSFAVVTAHDNEDPDAALTRIVGAALAVDSLVIMMGMTRLAEIVNALIQAGLPHDRPAAVVQWGTTPRQRVASGTLTNIVATAQKGELGPPAVILIGDVVSLRARLDTITGDSLSTTTRRSSLRRRSKPVVAATPDRILSTG